MKRWIAMSLAALLACGVLTGCFSEGGVKPAPLVESVPPAASESQFTQVPVSDGNDSIASAGSTEPAPATFKLVVPEGFTLARIGMRLEELGICEDQAFVDATQNGDFSGYALIGALPENPNRCFTLEGYLFPATYEFSVDATPEEIIGKLLSTSESRFSQVSAEVAASGYSLNDIVTLASVIEKEAKGEESMALISSVFHNRLNQGMPLQSDPTIKYVENVIKLYITGDKDRYNEYYNTYKCPALPAGPICNPGMAAINAALHPAESNYLFFLTDENDEFYFAETFEEHNENRAKTGV